MNRFIPILFTALLAVLLPTVQAQSSSPSDSEGAHVCSPIGASSSTQTPVQLYENVVRCVASGEFDAATEYFALAGAYGRFDTLRVADVSAHQVVGALKTMAYSRMPAARKVEFQKSAGQTYDDPEKHSALCKRVNSVGPPSYFPSYMLAHGLDTAIAVQQGQSPPGLVSPFDADAAWRKVITSYVGCR